METLEEEIRKASEKLYIKHQETSGLEVGDTVKVTRKAESFESGWPEVWLEVKNKFIGHEFKIKNVNDRFGIGLRYDEDELSWHFPYFVLEKVEQPTIRVEYMLDEGRWDESSRPIKKVEQYTFVTNTSKYEYYTKDTLLFRVRRED